MRNVFLGFGVGSFLTAAVFVLSALFGHELSFEKFDPDSPLRWHPAFGNTTDLAGWLGPDHEPDYRMHYEKHGYALDGVPMLYFFIYHQKIPSSAHVLVLLHAGADPNLEYDGISPHLGYGKISPLLGHDGISPLQVAIQRRHFLNVVLLVEFGADLDDPDALFAILDEPPEDDDQADGHLTNRIRDYLTFRIQNPPERALTWFDLSAGLWG